MKMIILLKAKEMVFFLISPNDAQLVYTSASDLI